MRLLVGRRCRTMAFVASPRLDIRADALTLERVDRLAARMSMPGAELTRSDAARAALLRGLEILEAENPDPAAKKGGSPARKPAAKKS
jgi:hypothetical protein